MEITQMKCTSMMISTEHIASVLSKSPKLFSFQNILLMKEKSECSKMKDFFYETETSSSATYVPDLDIKDRES